MTSTTGTAAIYCRISRDATGEGEGIGRQEALCRELASRESLEVVEVYNKDNDIGASDRTGAVPRPDYERLLDDARLGRFTHILAYSNSRLTRRLRELEDLIQLHEKTGVVIRTVIAGQDDLSTSDGRMVARIKASVDAAESDRISERQKAAFRHNALAGKPKLHHQRPFGWEEDGVTLRESEASLVRDAIEKIKAGASVTEVRHEWEAAGVLTAAGRSEWEHSALKRVLVGWRAAGVRTYKREPLYDTEGKLVVGLWEPIISLEDREEALAILSNRTLKKKRQGKWLLSGLVRCAVCGGSMYGQLTGTPTYACKPGRGHLAITAEKLEEYVQRAVVSRLSTRMFQESSDKGEVKPTEWPKTERLATVSRKITELMEAYNADVLPAQVAFAQVDKLEAERSELQKDRERHYAEQAKPASPMRRTSELLEWALDLLVVTSGQANSFDTFGDSEDDDEDNGGAWGGSGTKDKNQGAPDADDAAKRRLIRSELEEVIVKRGPRGRAGWGKAAFEARVEIRWRE